MTEVQPERRRPSRLKTYLQLMRFPAVFTAMADIFAGFLLVHSTLEPAFEFGWLLAASSCLYLAGMVFNDIFDLKLDAVERPERPIPSGRISLQTAVKLGVLLVAGGLGSAQMAGLNSLIVAGLLLAMIFLYDGILKNFWIGPLAMGSCRFLNIILGASTGPEGPWAMPQLLVAAAMGIYIVGLTWFARTEAHVSSRRQLSLAAVVINAGLATLGYFFVTWQGARSYLGVLLALVVFALMLNRRLWTAISNPVPENVQTCVKILLQTIIVLNATVVIFATDSRNYALAVIALVLPMLLLSRWMRVT